VSDFWTVLLVFVAGWLTGHVLRRIRRGRGGLFR